MNLKVPALGIGLCVALTFGSDVKACDCVPSPPPHAAFAEADVVFRGKAIEVQDTSALPRWELRPFYFVVRFEVTTAWKGVVGREFALGTGRGGGDCGKSFKRGDEYVVYAYRDDRVSSQNTEPAKRGQMSWPEFTTNICTRTARVGDAREDLHFLKSQKPQPRPEAPKRDEPPKPKR